MTVYPVVSIWILVLTALTLFWVALTDLREFKVRKRTGRDLGLPLRRLHRRRPAAFGAFVDNSAARGVEGILVSGLNTIPGLRQIEETLRALRAEALVTADKRAGVNRCDFGLLGKVAKADHVARILGDEKRLFVRNSRVALECVNLGTPMTIAYPSEKAVKDIAAIADYCVALKSAAPRRL